MSKIIPYGRQHITAEDIAAVSAALQSDFLTQGPKIREFEEAFATYTGARYAVAVSNGTAALHLGALALGTNENSNVITTPITFAASANCVRYCGGSIWFADISADTYTIDIGQVEQLIVAKPKGFFHGIIPVDFAGRPVDLAKLRQLADRHGLWIMEDACHSPGGFFKDVTNQQQHCGNGRYADVSVFSFHPVKHIASGEGGMITTNSEAVYNELLKLRTHGITRDMSLFTNDKDWAAGNASAPVSDYPGWYMEMQELGLNYRLTDFQAALGISQLSRADESLVRRREIAGRYASAFQGKSWLYGQSGDIQGHAYHLYIIEVKDRLGLYNYLKIKGIYAQVHYIPVHLMPYYRKLGYSAGDFPLSETYYSRCLSLPMYPTLSDEELEFVIQTVNSFYA